MDCVSARCMTALSFNQYLYKLCLVLSLAGVATSQAQYYDEYQDEVDEVEVVKDFLRYKDFYDRHGNPGYIDVWSNGQIDIYNEYDELVGTIE